jgi:hypothetical protein
MNFLLCIPADNAGATARTLMDGGERAYNHPVPDILQKEVAS